MKRTLILVLLLTTSCARSEEVDVSAAASLRDALETIAVRYEQRTGVHVLLNCGASSTLAMQIGAGAPADIFFSADEMTMNLLAIVPDTRRDLLSNTLVVLSNRPLAGPRDLVSLHRVALADPSSVPAGVYARRWLEREGLWTQIVPHVIPTADVRASLAAVDGGNVDAAIVYRTDAMLAKRAKVVFEVSGPTSPSIRYPVAILRHARHPAAARRFWAYLQTDEPAAIFRKFGFVVIGRRGV